MAADEGYTGTVAGITFKDGEAVARDGGPHLHGDGEGARVAASLRGFFRRRGYTVTDGGRVVRSDTVTAAPASRPLDARDATGEAVGTKLRDASVDPKPEDFLAPTNAGEEDPHGPDVVSPQIHGSQDVRPVRPGPVAVDDTAVQDMAETAHAADATDVTIDRPAGNAKRDAWAAYAASVGVAIDDADSRDDIRGKVLEHEG